MSDTLEKLQVIIEANIKEFKSAFQAAYQEAKSGSARINSEVNKVKAPFQDDSQVNKSLGAIRKMQLAMKNFVAGAKVKSGLFNYTDEYLLLAHDIEVCQQRLRELQLQQKQFKLYGGDVNSDEYKQLSADTEAAQHDLEQLYMTMSKLDKGPGFTKFAGATAVLKKLGHAAVSVGKKLGQLAIGAIRKAGGAAASLIKRFASGIPIFRRFGNAGQRALGGLGTSLKNLVLAGLGVRSLTTLLSKLRSIITEGFQNIAEAFPASETAQNINMLKSSLAQLKASLTGAFAPIFNVVAPALNWLIQAAITAANAVGQLIAALTGKSFVVAQANVGGVSSGLGGAADNANAANSAAQKLKRTLMGFDQINKLDDTSEDSSSGSGGGGGGGGLGGTFQEMEVSGQISDFAKKIKEAWAKADFTEIGNIVGTKIKGALDSIPWDDIKEQCNKIAKDVATFLNGFFGTKGLFDSIGKTVAEALNTVFGAAETFADKVDWKLIGNAISEGINSFIDDFKWETAFASVVKISGGIFTALTTALGGIDWSSLQNKISEGIKKIDWTEIGNQTRTGIANLGTAMGGFLSTAFSGLSAFATSYDWGSLGEGIGSGINNFFASHPISKGAEAAANLANGLLKTIGTAFRKTNWKSVGQEVVNGIMTFFTTFDWRQLGGTLRSVFLGLLELLTTIFDRIPWSDLPEIIVEAIKDFFSGLLEDPGETAQIIADFLESAVTAGFELLVLPGKVLAEALLQALESALGVDLQTFHDILKTLGFSSGGKSFNPEAGSIIGQATDVEKEAAGMGSGEYSTSVANGALKLDIHGHLTSLTDDLDDQQRRIQTNGAFTANSTVTGADKVPLKYRKLQTHGEFKTNSRIYGTMPLAYRKLQAHGVFNNKSKVYGSMPEKYRTLDSIAKFKSTIDNISNKHLDGFNAHAKYFTDNIPSDRKVINNATAVVKNITTRLTAAGGIYTAGNWRPIQSYAAGGNPNQGQLFIAREAGPELVGNLGGHTAVMNNNQIVSSVSEGVYRAMLAAMEQKGDGNVGVTIVLEGDSKQLFRVVKKEAQNYTNATGLSPFPA